MNHFYTLKVAKIQKVTDEAENYLSKYLLLYKININLNRGNILTLKFNFGEESFRSYSIIDAPSENSQTLSILVKQMENGTISTFLNQNLKENDEGRSATTNGKFLYQLSRI